jgi:probable rRNA maturation factor
MADTPFPPFEARTTPQIDFHCEDVPDPGIETGRWVAWIKRIIQHHRAQLGTLQYIFCSDDYLHRLNVEHLQHDTLTDIITFPYSDPPLVSGDIFISTERVVDNAKDLDISFDTELRRVLIHGVLHLCGFPDKKPEEARRMRALEDEALALYS